jgi:hypothetical protein
MPLSRRGLTRLALSAVLAPALPAPLAAADGAPFSLEDFFEGRTRGEGRFVSDLFDVERGIVVDTVGRWDGRTLVLTEHVAYSDGARETAIWRFDKTGPATYDGQRTKVAGVVPVRAAGGEVRMSYVAEVAGPDGRAQRLRFADVLRRTGPDTVVNTARVSFLGLTVGHVEITFRKR